MTSGFVRVCLTVPLVLFLSLQCCLSFWCDTPHPSAGPPSWKAGPDWLELMGENGEHPGLKAARVFGVVNVTPPPLRCCGVLWQCMI